jgi:epoxyqueuosine reductase QueG
MIKEEIRSEIERFSVWHQEQRHTQTRWRTPLVGFASAEDTLFKELKKAVSPTHALPAELFPGARSVVAYFLPFEESIVHSNVAGQLASRKWAQAYVETNVLIKKLNFHMKDYLESQGYAVLVMPPTHNFNPDNLISDWSHRHVAFVAGLGRFGLNNMLITESGCCGRIGSFITSLRVTPDPRPQVEACLYHYNASCTQCVTRCVNESLVEDEFNRHTCYQMCRANEAKYRSLGRADVCGKCLVDVPCSLANPVKKLRLKIEHGI